MDGRSRLDRYQNLRSGMNRNDTSESTRNQPNSFDNTDSYTSLNRNYQRTVPTPSRQASEYESMLKEHEDFLKSLDEQFENLNKGTFSESVIQGNQPRANEIYNPYGSNAGTQASVNNPTMATYEQPAQPNYGYQQPQQPYGQPVQPAYNPNYGYPQQPYGQPVQPNYGYPQQPAPSNPQDIIQQNSLKQMIENQRFAIPEVNNAQPQSLNMFVAPETKVASAFSQDSPVQPKPFVEPETIPFMPNNANNTTEFARAAFASVSNKQPKPQVEMPTYINPFPIVNEQPKVEEPTPAFNNPFSIPAQQPASQVYSQAPNFYQQPASFEQPQPVQTPAYQQPASFEQPQPVQTPAYQQPASFEQPQAFNAPAEQPKSVEVAPVTAVQEEKTPEISVVDDDENPYVSAQPVQPQQEKPAVEATEIEQPKPVEEIKQAEETVKEDFSIDDISSLVGELNETPVEEKVEEPVAEKNDSYDDFDSYINDVLSGFETEEKREPIISEPVKQVEEVNPVAETEKVDERVSIEDKIPGIFFVEEKDEDIDSIKKEISGWEFKENEFSIGEPAEELQVQVKEEIKPSNTIESPIYYDDPKNVKDLTAKLNQEKQLNDELLEKTRALDYQVSEYQNEVEDANKNNTKLNRILNLVLTLLILALFIILFVIGFWFINERGLTF